MRVPSDDAVGTTKTVSCKICGVNLVDGQSRRQHNRTKEHQAAVEKKKKETGRDEVLFLITL
jgi:hypothetical protein